MHNPSRYEHGFAVLGSSSPAQRDVLSGKSSEEQNRSVSVEIGSVLAQIPTANTVAVVEATVSKWLSLPECTASMLPSRRGVFSGTSSSPASGAWASVAPGAWVRLGAATWWGAEDSNHAGR